MIGLYYDCPGSRKKGNFSCPVLFSGISGKELLPNDEHKTNETQKFSDPLKIEVSLVMRDHDNLNTNSL